MVTDRLPPAPIDPPVTCNQPGWLLDIFPATPQLLVIVTVAVGLNDVTKMGLGNAWRHPAGSGVGVAVGTGVAVAVGVGAGATTSCTDTVTLLAMVELAVSPASNSRFPVNVPDEPTA